MGPGVLLHPQRKRWPLNPWTSRCGHVSPRTLSPPRFNLSQQQSCMHPVDWGPSSPTASFRWRISLALIGPSTFLVRQSATCPNRDHNRCYSKAP